jgi:lipopolysaccharide/colanic/teichoic acid biosynthesis glycosyltransferase
MRRRLPVKPGITGLWPMDERGAQTVDDPAAATDLHYVSRWTPARDVRILLHTVRVTLDGGRASR